LQVRVISGLKAGRLEELSAKADAVPEVVKALDDSDGDVSNNARKVLSQLGSNKAKDTLIDCVLEKTGLEMAVPIINEKGYRHSDSGRWFLYLAVVGRFDDYLREDYDFQRLRPEFKAAPAALQERIHKAILDSGDTRMNGLFVSERRETLLAELTESDAELLVRINVRNRNWEALFKYLWVLPARHISTAVKAMAEAGWQPDDEDKKTLFGRLVKLTRQLEPAPEPLKMLLENPVLKNWFENGQKGAIFKKSARELKAMLNEKTPPPEQIAALGALQKKGELDEETLRKAGHSPHWLVRITAVSLGAPPGYPNNGGCIWFKLAIYDCHAIWGIKPCQVGRDGLEALQAGLKRMGDRRRAGGLNLVEAMVVHYTAHDIEVEDGARVIISETDIEIQ